jgi:hypothetical protein
VSGDFSALIRQIVCPLLRALAANELFRPVIEPLILRFGC